MSKFVFVKIEDLKRILDKELFDKTINIYKDKLHFDKYIKLMSGRENYCNNTIEILNIKKCITDKDIVLFSIPVEFIEDFIYKNEDNSIKQLEGEALFNNKETKIKAFKKTNRVINFEVKIKNAT